MGRNKIVGLVGLRGSGKSTALCELISCRPRLVVLDLLGEHDFGHITDFDGAMEALEEVSDRERFAVTVRLGRGDIGAMVDEICEAVFDIGNLWLGLEEVPHFATAGWMPPGLDVLARMGRHKNVSLVFTGQRFSELPRRLTATSDYFILFPQREPRDLEALAERVGRSVAEEVSRLSLHSWVLYDVLAGCCRKGGEENGH